MKGLGNTILDLATPHYSGAMNALVVVLNGLFLWRHAEAMSNIACPATEKECKYTCNGVYFFSNENRIKDSLCWSCTCDPFTAYAVACQQCVPRESTDSPTYSGQSTVPTASPTPSTVVPVFTKNSLHVKTWLDPVGSTPCEGAPSVTNTIQADSQCHRATNPDGSASYLRGTCSSSRVDVRFSEFSDCTFEALLVRVGYSGC